MTEQVLIEPESTKFLFMEIADRRYVRAYAGAEYHSAIAGRFFQEAAVEVTAITYRGGGQVQFLYGDDSYIVLSGRSAAYGAVPKELHDSLVELIRSAFPKHIVGSSRLEGD